MTFQDNRILGEQLALLGFFHVLLQGEHALDPGSLKSLVQEEQQLLKAFFGDTRGFEGP